MRHECYRWVQNNALVAQLQPSASAQVKYREATPPNEQLVVRSNVVNIKENTEKPGSGKPSVQVDITLHKVLTLYPMIILRSAHPVQDLSQHLSVISTGSAAA